MRGFTLIEVIISMAIIAIGILAIFEAVNSIGDTVVQCRDLNSLIHFSESKFNEFKSIETNVYSFAGDIEDKDYIWTYIQDEIGIYNIKRTSIVINSKNSDFKVLELYEYKANM